MSQRTALIATLPKSGTWYSHNFFWCYEQLLQHTDEYMAGMFKPDLLAALANKSIPKLSTHTETLGLDKLFICHSVCPGFSESTDERKGQWEALSFPLPYNWGENFVRENDAWDTLNPALNPEARIVYLYRNPLDHFVSYYRHTHSHIDAGHRTKTLPDGTQAPIETLQDFIFSAGMLGAFIKHYYSFLRMQARYPRQVMMKSYEHLTLNPREAFSEILTFMGSNPKNPLDRRLFDEALFMCSRESLMSIESKMGRSMAGDQVGNEKHIRDGGIGLWTLRLSSDDIERIESVFQLFGISLLDFNLEGGASPQQDLSWLSTIDPLKKQANQIAFLEHQLALAGISMALRKKQIVRSGLIAWLDKSKMQFFKALRRSPLAGPLRTVRAKIMSPGSSATLRKIDYRYKKT